MNKLFPDSDINVEFNGPHMTDVEFQVESDERDKMELYITLVLYIGRIVRGEDADLAGRMASAVSRIANAGIEPDDEDPPDYLH